MPPDPGPCHDKDHRLFYDVHTDICQYFLYGGCEGNQNNFESVEECQSVCGGFAQSSFDCFLLPDPGPCYGHFPRIFYDVYSGTCKDFIYGGCEGNQNNFESVQTCESVCEVSAPSDSGGPKAWRDDLRCGEGYTAPNGEVAQCDPDGTWPCCSPHKWCGNTAAHCTCGGCIDYSGKP
ncbi:Carboxypeptidase inhibitor SmCI [Holothuria leucospilota]|uniref:Carboxypeptidase inhibitor SmCI n=1 Tax=Holothuria leucospilota TaxID=206669 RepID=A0A9Q1C4B4_HOLLE|nr:Carboxypeptidase inhibitor SmCI [Holothuria leucospilota]